MEDPQKIKKRTTIQAIPLLSIYLKKTKTLIQKGICTLMFIVALLNNSQDMETT